jgi:copper oxidase (laccase) domain-containing protein
MLAERPRRCRQIHGISMLRVHMACEYHRENTDCSVTVAAA